MSESKHVGAALVYALLEGKAALQCSMEACICPDGREHFERHGRWRVSADRFPIPGRDGGLYTPDNVRLAHLACNQSEKGRVPRDAQVRGALAMHAGWGKTPEAREARQRAQAALTFEQKSLGGQRGYRTRAERGDVIQVTAAEASRGGTIGTCSRWNIARGKACVCGTHSTEEAS
jgi:hypothetical protein